MRTLSALIAAALMAGYAAAQATITYVEEKPLVLQESFQIGEAVNIKLPENYRIVVNDQPITVAGTGTVTYKFERPGDYVVVTQRRSGDTWVPVSEAKTTVVAQSTTTTTTTTTSNPVSSTTVKKTTTTTQPATTTVSSGGMITITEDKPLVVRETYRIGEPITVHIPETVKTEYRLRINGQPVAYDSETRQIHYEFDSAGDYEIVTEKRVGDNWTSVSTSKTVVVD